MALIHVDFTGINQVLWINYISSVLLFAYMVLYVMCWIIWGFRIQKPVLVFHFSVRMGSLV